MGFFTSCGRIGNVDAFTLSQSLSGWDGVFHALSCFVEKLWVIRVAIPFRVGWGFSPEKSEKTPPGLGTTRRNPFQGGMGFFTIGSSLGLSGRPAPGRNPFQGGMGFFTNLRKSGYAVVAESQSLSGWDGVFHLRRGQDGARVA